MQDMIVIGGVLSIVVNLISMQISSEEKDKYIKNIKNIVFAVIISKLIFSVDAIIKYYF